MVQDADGAAGPSLRGVEGQRLEKLLGADMVLVSPEAGDSAPSR
jgi:hypothetical protein